MTPNYPHNEDTYILKKMGKYYKRGEVNWMKRNGILFLLGCIMAILLSGNVNASVKPNGMMYVNTKYVNAKITLDGNSVKGTVEAEAYSRCSISITMKLQKKVSGSWNTINTWTLSGANVLSLSLSKTSSISHGTYRIQGIVNTGGEVVTKNSTSKTY